MRDRGTKVFWFAGEAKGFGSTERDGGPDSALGLGGGTLHDGLLRSLGLGHLRGGGCQDRPIMNDELTIRLERGGEKSRMTDPWTRL